MGQLHRTQLLLEPEQYRALAQMARTEGRSISEIVRDIVRRVLQEQAQHAERDLRRQLEALEQIRGHHEQLLAQRGRKPIDFDVVEEIRQAREERDERNLSWLKPRS